MIKSKKQIFLVISVFALVMLLGTVTYAFFNYTRTGISNTIRVGRIYFNTTQNNTINLSNVFPTTSNNLDNTNSDTVTVNITGDTTYSEGIEYKVTLEEVNNTINGKEVPISFNVTANNLGTKSSNYYNERGSTTNVYNLIETGQVEEDKYILVGYIKPDDTGVNGSINITAFIDSSNIAISDTVSRIDNGNLIYGETTGDWIAGRVVFTTEEWNSFSRTPLSFKVKVEANEGIWVEPERILVMKNIYSESNWSAIRANITSVEFSTSSEIPANAITSFDATDVTSSGPVKVYTLDDGLGKGTYKAIICGDGIIYAPENSRALFASMPKLTTINLDNFRMDNVTTMKYMFAGNTNLMNINISDKWNTSNVENMNGMFNQCTNLSNVIGLEKLDTSNVTDMAMMFFQCTNLSNVDGLINWNTSRVENMNAMFAKCTNLSNVDGLINWNTSRVENMNAMFDQCTSLSNVDGLKNWNTSSVQDMNGMFAQCTSLSNVDGLINWNTANVTKMYNMFGQCTNLLNINGLINWNTSSVQTMQSMFYKCTNLSNVDGLRNWNTSNVTRMDNMFNDCSNLVSADISSWNMSNVISNKVMFQDAGFNTIIMPNNYTRIDDFMFNHNTNYNEESFTIPKSVTTVGNSHIFYNFGKDSTFNKFIVESGSTSLKTIDDILYTYDGTRLISIPRGKTFANNTYEIPEGVTFMNELSFSRNRNIDTIVLPNSYVIERYIKANDSSNTNNNSYGFINSGNSLSIAVYRYTSVKEYEVKQDNPNYSSDSGCIYSKDGTELIAVPLHYTGVLNIKSGTTTIGKEAFWTDTDVISQFDSITGINIPASVTTIEANQLTTLNSLMSRSTNPVTITIDSGNTAYQISGNKIVAR